MSERKEHWEKIYQAKPSQQLTWYQEKPELSLQLIRNTQLPLDASVIDVGGGASTLVDHLCEAGYTDIGVLDLSANALAATQERLGDKASEVTWYVEDVTCFTPPRLFSLWHDRAVFHFLTEQSDREHYVSTLKRSLVPGGHLIIATFAIGGPTQCSGLDIVQYDADKLVAELGEDFELVEQANERHITPRDTGQEFVYFRLVKKG